MADDVAEFEQVTRLSGSASADHEDAVDLRDRHPVPGVMHVRLLYRFVDDTKPKLPKVSRVVWAFDGVEHAVDQQPVWEKWPGAGGILYCAAPLDLDGAAHEATATVTLPDGDAVVTGAFGPPADPDPDPLVAALVAAGAAPDVAALVLSAALGNPLDENERTAIVDGLAAVDPERLSLAQLRLVGDVAVTARRHAEAEAEALDLARKRFAWGTTGEAADG